MSDPCGIPYLPASRTEICQQRQPDSAAGTGCSPCQKDICMNQEFEQQMKDLLGNEYDAYMACLQQPPGRGFRINTLKGNADHLIIFQQSKLHHDVNHVMICNIDSKQN